MSSDEAEVREEVAEAVQAARREGLRDDLLGMVCPSDWTTQAPEPLGTLHHTSLLSKFPQSHALCQPYSLQHASCLCVQQRLLTLAVLTSTSRR